MLLLRINHVAHAISVYRHSRRISRIDPLPGAAATGQPAVAEDAAADADPVPWDGGELWRAVEESRAGYTLLLQFPAAAGGRPAHLIFYEDLKRSPASVWDALQRFLGLPPLPFAPGKAAAGSERQSGDRPAVLYLERLSELQEELKGEDWGDMLQDPHYDDAVDPAHAFAEACRLHPSAPLSWRGAESCAAVLGQ